VHLLSPTTILLLPHGSISTNATKHCLPSMPSCSAKDDAAKSKCERSFSIADITCGGRCETFVPWHPAVCLGSHRIVALLWVTACFCSKHKDSGIRQSLPCVPPSQGQGQTSASFAAAEVMDITQSCSLLQLSCCYRMAYLGRAARSGRRPFSMWHRYGSWGPGGCAVELSVTG
jgi:hypothetical protein